MATELGKAYVQIMPSAQGIKGAISNLMEPEAVQAGEQSGKGLGGSLIGTVGRLIAAAGIGATLAKSLSAGGALQQSLGGIETLFKGSADTVKKHAEEAYRTAGLSANAYMEKVTGFSASLLQSLAGDTDKAAQISNMAMIDMADNSNKMGTAMEDIQNAYQGFAKQNYTMLDNLKLGYGGTKSEMERLLADAEKLTGVKYDITNLSDVFQAIHAIQQKLDITGTTAKEASTTLSGSFAAVKASFENVLGQLALGENIQPALEGLAQSVATFLFGNLIPMVLNILSSLPPSIIAFFATAAPLFMAAGADLINNLSQGLQTSGPTILQNISAVLDQMISWVKSKLPDMLQSGVDLITHLANGLLQSLPDIIRSIGDILSKIFDLIMAAAPTIMQNGVDLISKLASGLIQNMPAIIAAITDVLKSLLAKIVEHGPNILSKGIELIGKLASGLIQNIPAIVSAIVQVVTRLIATIVSHLPQILAKGVEIVGKIAAGILSAVGQVLSAIGSLMGQAVTSIAGFVGRMVSAGVDLMLGLARGIGNAVGDVVAKAKAAASRVVNSVKSFFGIRSPSRVFAEIGFRLDQGLAKGIEDNIGLVSTAMDDVQNEALRDMQNTITTDVDFRGAQSSLTGAIDKGSEQRVLLKIVDLLLQMLKKDANVYIDKDKLIGTIIGDINTELAYQQSSDGLALGGM